MAAPNDVVELRSARVQNRTRSKINKMLTFKTYMGCCSLRTGCLVIAYTNLIVGILLVVLFSLILSLIDNPDPNLCLAFAVTFAFITIEISLHAVLLFGAHQKRRKLLRIYIIGSVIFTMILLIIDLIIIAFVTTQNAKRLLQYLYILHCMLVVRSYNIQLVEEEQEAEQQRNEMTLQQNLM